MIRIPRSLVWVALLLATPTVLLACGGDPASDAEQDRETKEESGPPGATEGAPQTAEALAAQGLDFLLGRYHAEEQPTWGPEITQGRFHVGMNAMVLNGLLRAPEPVLPSDDERVKATLTALVERAWDNPHGIVWSGQQNGYAVYESATSLRAFVEAARQDREWREASEADEVIRRVRRYLLSAQIDEVQELGFEDDFQVSGPEDELGQFYGGWGYGQVRRENRHPSNMSTTNLAMEALYESFEVVQGTSEEREQFEAAQRKLQNYLRNVHNLREYHDPDRGRTVRWNDAEVDQAWDPRDPQEATFVPGNDGGAIYSVGSSKAGYDELEGGLLTPRSYGSITYALLRLYVMSGISPEDPRVQAAYNWVRDAEHYTFEYNPGFELDGQSEYQGLYYYIYTASDTLARLAPEGRLVDTRGEEHNWRQDITRRLAQEQEANGGWINDMARWDEADPRLATAYALIALGYTAEPPARN